MPDAPVPPPRDDPDDLVEDFGGPDISYLGEPDRSGLTDADLEPKPPSRLGRRLRFIQGWQLLLIMLLILIVAPLILAVALNPLIGFLSR